MAKFMRVILQSFFFAVIAAMILISWLLMEAKRPLHLDAPRQIMIERGMGTLDVISRLSHEQIVPNKYALLLVAILKGDWGQFKAGEYEFTPGISTAAIAEKIARGEVLQRKITVPEGYTVGDVIRLLQSIETLSGDIVAPPQEGRLLPETYAYIRGDSRQSVINRMVAGMDGALTKIWAARPSDCPLKSPEELLTLASIVEKETGVATERPMVASVFLNRLKAGMKLQSDPTVIYALTKGAEQLDRLLTTRDLEKTDSPYNTYMYGGLPPGPIANPGLSSLRAVINPATTGYYYFVADGTGGHAFAATLKDHNSNVAKWRRINAAAHAAAP
jgi:UPF0755 protein